MFAGFSTWIQGQNIDMFNRSMHNTVVEPANHRLWLIGVGFTGPRTTEAATPTQFCPSDDLWLESEANNTNEDDSELGPGQLPRELGKEIEAFRAMKL